MPNPTHVIIRLDEPVGPDDAQNLARHIVSELAFADVESARPCSVEERWPPSERIKNCILAGEEVRHLSYRDRDHYDRARDERAESADE